MADSVCITQINGGLISGCRANDLFLMFTSWIIEIILPGINIDQQRRHKENSGDQQRDKHEICEGPKEHFSLLD
jgi:hypothetical protein